jgi:hypothetical protein
VARLKLSLFGYSGWCGKALIIALFVGTCRILHAATLYSPNTNATPLSPELTNAPVRQIGAGLFQVGRVRFDKERKTISFPAVLNMREGVVEYLLVNSVGKLHESVLRSEAEPYHIHLAALLIGGISPTNHAALGISRTSALPGQSISLSITWQTPAGPKNLSGEELVYNSDTKASMSRGPWLYNGSRLSEGTFLAQRDGSIVSIVADPDALVNNTRPGRENDEIWQVNAANAPLLGTPVEVTLKF